MAPSRLTRHAARIFFGREQELELLDNAWNDPSKHVLSLIAWGGVGKTALVSHWIATRMAAKDWPGVQRYFDWSFYSQGTGDSRQTSSDLFMNEALGFFSDQNPTVGSPWERGQRLAGLIRKERTLLILDGIEPLQFPPTDRSGQAGRLKDQALEALIQSLVQENNGLCIITSREHLSNIDSYPSQQEFKLDKLPLGAAIALLRQFQLTGTDQEIQEMWEHLDGHVLSILQLGRLLARGYGKDIRKWREIGFEQADKLQQGRSTMRVMAKYESWLAAGDNGKQLELAILRLMSLFDRPMSPDSFWSLRQPPEIPGLTDLFVEVAPFEIESAITTLIENDLLSHCGGDDYVGSLLNVDLDVHPLIREYFAKRLHDTQRGAFRAAHSRLFDYLCKNTLYQPDSLTALAPLYDAVVHGCLAGRYTESLEDVYIKRIQRLINGQSFAMEFLGSVGMDLAALSMFFEKLYSEFHEGLSGPHQAFILNDIGIRLRSLGRFQEAIPVLETGLEMRAAERNDKDGAINAINLAELYSTSGLLELAVESAKTSVSLAKSSQSVNWHVASLSTLGEALFLVGKFDEAGRVFQRAADVLRSSPDQPDLLYGLWGYSHRSFFLRDSERGFWQIFLSGSIALQKLPKRQLNLLMATLSNMRQKGIESELVWIQSETTPPPLVVACDKLLLCRVDIYKSLIENQELDKSAIQKHNEVVNLFRHTRHQDILPKAMLMMSTSFALRQEWSQCTAILDEAQHIAERGSMLLHLADIHLHRARLFRDKAELGKAAKIILEIGYGRRFEELADAEAAINQADPLKDNLA